MDFSRTAYQELQDIGVFRAENSEPITNILSTDPGFIFILIEYSGIKYLILVEVFVSMKEDLYVKKSSIIFVGEEEGPLNLRACIFKEFIDHYDTTKNVIYLENEELITFPRKVITEDIL